MADLQEREPQETIIRPQTPEVPGKKPANNVLMTGARGTGKSSLVKSMLAAHGDQGLRLIEVDKSDLGDLGEIVDLIGARPERFIVFCDDLSFEEGEAGYKALKRSEEHTSELQSLMRNLVCRLLLENKK